METDFQLERMEEEDDLIQAKTSRCTFCLSKAP
jgi:hypothetical protein